MKVVVKSGMFCFSKKKRRSASQSTCQVVTPVRRSTRRSLQNLPESLKDSKPSFAHKEDLDGQDNLLFQPNIALESMLDEVENEVDESVENILI